MATNGNRNEAYLRRRRVLRRRKGGGHAPRRTNAQGISIWLKAGVALGVFGLIGLVAAASTAIVVYNSYASDLLAPDELAINQPSYGAIILDRNGTQLYEYVDDRAGLRRPVRLDEVSEAFLAATIATEDESFFSNPGVNIRGLARAAWENSPFGGDLFEGSGGSSITQQLVKNVYISEAERYERWSNEGISRKIKETVYAIELTQKYSKDRILEWYINQISYGGVFNGVEAASQGYFGKPASELTLAEAALLAGIPQSPVAYHPVHQPVASEVRRNEILDLMVRHGRIQIGEDRYYEVTPAMLAEAREAQIEIKEGRFDIEAPHWVLSYVEPQLRSLLGCPQLSDLQQEVIAGTRGLLADKPGEGCPALFTDGLVVRTTLDLELQNEIQGIMEHHISEFENISNSRNGSMMITDPKTGEILVMIGSRDYWRDDIYGRNNNAIACNSPGSSFKPFSYLVSFMELGWGPGTVVLDTPVTYPNPGGDPFTPTNPANNFSGPVTIRHSLGNSLNIPAVKVADAVGPQTIVSEARKLGFVDTFRMDGCSSGFYGPAMATGGMSVTLDEMMFAYTVLANGGVLRGQEPIIGHDEDERQVDPVSILHITDNRGQTLWDIDERRKAVEVIDPAFAYLIWDILTDPQATCATFQCGGLQIDGYRVAVKTGTSAPFDRLHRCAGKIGETWSFGYSPDLVVGIWAGNSDNDCIENIFSTSIAFRSVRDAFRTAHAGIAATQYARPDNVVQAEVCVPSGLKPTRLCGRTTRDLFVKDKLPQEDDTWWREVEVDIRNNLLAGPRTPRQFIERRVMLALPDEVLRSEQDRRTWEEWARALNVQLAPTQESDLTGPLVPGSGTPGVPGTSGDANVAIYAPLNGRTVSGLTQIVGSATSRDFKQYRLEYGSGSNPRDWTLLVRLPMHVQLGTIGVWDTSGLEPGTYTLRLVVEDERRGEIATSIQVLVGGGFNQPAQETPTPPLAP